MLQTIISSEQAKEYIDKYGIENLISNSYIHSHKETAQYGIKLANNKLIYRSKIGNFFTNSAEFNAWKKQSEYLIDRLRQKEKRLLYFLGGNYFTKKNFIDLITIIENNLGPIYQEMDQYSYNMSSVKRGFKRKEDIDYINNLNSRIIQIIEDTTNSLNTNEQEQFNKIKEEIEILNSSIDKDQKSFEQRINQKDTKIHISNSKSISIYYYITQIIPKYFEYKSEVVINNFIDLINQQLDKNIKVRIEDTSNNTKLNTSADRAVTLFMNNKKIKFSISAKTSKKNILQKKTGKIAELLSGKTVSGIDKTSLENIFNNIKNGNNIETIKYMITNYIVNEDIDKRSISNAIKIIALAYVNEKIFGFNKAGQAELKLRDIIGQIPLITYSTGGVHFLSDVLEELVKNIENNVSNITKIYNNYFIRKNKENIIEINKEEAFRSLQKEGSPFIYEKIINKIGQKIFEQKMDEILSSSEIQIQYSIPYSF